MNLLSPGDLILAVRRRSLCSVPPVLVKVDGNGTLVAEGSPEVALTKKEKKRRSSLTEQSPSRKASFFQR